MEPPVKPGRFNHESEAIEVRSRSTQGGRVIGGFPVETLREDGTGLFGVGEVNLDTQAGREVYSMARQGVLRDF